MVGDALLLLHMNENEYFLPINLLSRIADKCIYVITWGIILQVLVLWLNSDKCANCLQQKWQICKCMLIIF